MAQDKKKYISFTLYYTLISFILKRRKMFCSYYYRNNIANYKYNVCNKIIMSINIPQVELIINYYSKNL